MSQILRSSTPRCPLDMSDLPHAFLHGYKVNYALVDAIMATSSRHATPSGSNMDAQNSPDAKLQPLGHIPLRPATHTDACVVSPRLRESRDLSGLGEISAPLDAQSGSGSRLPGAESPAWQALMQEYGLEQHGYCIADVEPHACSTSRTGPIHRGTPVRHLHLRSVTVKVKLQMRSWLST